MSGKNYTVLLYSMPKQREEIKFHLPTDLHKRLLKYGIMRSKFIICNCVLWKIKTNCSTAYRILEAIFF
jgi:hypothetical protein